MQKKVVHYSRITDIFWEPIPLIRYLLTCLPVAGPEGLLVGEGGIGITLPLISAGKRIRQLA